MVQRTQLDDTCFEYFVQLENARAGCLIPGYFRDSAAFSSLQESGAVAEFFVRRS